MKFLLTKRLLVLALLLNLMTFAYAQTLDEVTKTYNESVTQANEKPAATLKILNDLLPKAEALGDEAAEITGNITGMLPTLQYNVARADHDAKKTDQAIAGFEKTIELADKYNNADMKKQVMDQLPILYYSQGSEKIKAKDKKGAEMAFQKALKMDPTYSRAYYGISKMYRGTSMDSVKYYADKAIEMAGPGAKDAGTYKKGMRIYSAKTAKKQATAKKHKDAVTLYEQALSYTTAPENIQKYNYNIGKVYQDMGNTSKACDAYKKVTTGKYAKNAKYARETTLKCK